ncbi:hypothetical protein G9A89_016113 [Geosiphon pyriformis]|nr:hypothetical protein G9A89_016113 [Geosiphon pyriformis]
MGICCGDNKEYQTTTKFYCCACLVEHFERPKQVEKWDNTSCLACGKTLLDKEMWNDIPGRGGMLTGLGKRHQSKLLGKKLCIDWTVAHTTTMKYGEWHLPKSKMYPEPVINLLDQEQFHEHYQELAPTREEQKQWLEQLNTKLCYHCLIPSDFEYCNECDLIYNLPPHMIYTIPEEEEPISSCTLELESPFNPNSNSNNNNNNNKNTSSSSIQYDNNDNNNSNSDFNFDLKYEQYIAIPDLTKKQELKWFSDNNKSIMPEYTHDTDARFDLRYSEKDAIKLESHSCTYIDLKIALEIPATTMVQLASKSSLVKRGINIRGGIIDAGYVENIIAMLQNDSEKVYIIEPNKKIAQAIFLLLIKVAQLVPVGNKEELGITARGIQKFGSTGRIDVLVNMVEEEIIGQGEIISTAIKKREKEQEQIFEAKTTFCESGEIGLINLHIPAKSHNHIKILIYNNTRNVVEIPEETTLRYLTTEIEDQAPSSIPDFPQLCEYVNITSQTIYG